ncbi:MAG: ATP-binding cassette domain-containing protein [Clostridiales bacterium]|nr:MAG: ATP-binding cassette domain-containing protein [Clostridiales bacterium]
MNAVYEIEKHAYEKKYTGNYSAYLEHKKKNLEVEEKAYAKQQTEIKKLEEYVAKNLVRASTTKMAQSRQKKLDKMELFGAPERKTPTVRVFDFEIEYPSYKEVLNVEDLSVFVENSDGVRTLIKNADFRVLRGEKAALIGDNGAGKSTLLKTILGFYKKLYRRI